MSAAPSRQLFSINPRHSLNHQERRVKQIVIAQRGWVFIGNVERSGDDVTISDAKCIRRWGTTRGLGELAKAGPQRNTVLDDMGTVRLHALAVVASLDVEEAKWPAL